MSVSEVGSYGLWMLMVSGFGNYGIGLGLDPLNPASIYQNLHFCRVPTNSIIRVYNKNLQKSRLW